MTIGEQPDQRQIQVLAALQRYWGYSGFRSPQGEIIQCLLTGQDALVVMPTGGGKSLCFQLPALLQSGLTLIVSPLVALMENQVQELRDRRLAAASLHSELPATQKRAVIQAIARQKLRLLYLSPETLLSASVWQHLAAPDIQINGLILDEAHCLAQWGDTFRPAYRRLGSVRSSLLKQKPPSSRIALAAFTATADPRTQKILQDTLQLQNPQKFLLNPYRPNLQLQVRQAWTIHNRRQQLLQFIRRHPCQSGLVYVRSRSDSEALSQWLTSQGFATAPYHAGLGGSQRRHLEQQWLEGKLQFVVCTSAFGMGINKPDVRWVAQWQAPLLLSEYIQEVGRAGRDGQPATALTLTSAGWLDGYDRQSWQFLQQKNQKTCQQAAQIISKLPQRGSISHVAEQYNTPGLIALSLLHSGNALTWLDPFTYERSPQTPPWQKLAQEQQKIAQQTQKYLSSKQCRWQFLIQAFGFPIPKACGHCDNCR